MIHRSQKIFDVPVYAVAQYHQYRYGYIFRPGEGQYGAVYGYQHSTRCEIAHYLGKDSARTSQIRKRIRQLFCFFLSLCLFRCSILGAFLIVSREKILQDLTE